MKTALKHFPESRQTIRRWIGEVIAYFVREVERSSFEERPKVLWKV
ncbi:hypothetical protein CKA32_006613 [Geitlerinema sp. FC II]|nr:hypothetical protein CKA32_006613 [Geitlerinema sp. FC II]